MIKPQDILVVLSLCSQREAQTYAQMAQSLGLSASEAHGAVRRLEESRLVEAVSKKVVYGALCNFLIHGVPYLFAAHLKGVTIGIPTAWAAPAMKPIPGETLALPPVWPEAKGTVQGVALDPLYSSVPHAALLNPDLYDLLALVDALRAGRAKERRQASEEIFKRMTALASK